MLVNEKTTLYLHREPYRKEPPFYERANHAMHTLITRKILRSKDAQCKTLSTAVCIIFSSQVISNTFQVFVNRLAVSSFLASIKEFLYILVHFVNFAIFDKYQVPMFYISRIVNRHPRLAT